MKDGFLFEPINVNTKDHQAKPSTTNANVSFTSDIISPYTRTMGLSNQQQPPQATVMLKNPVDHDRLLDAARGAHVNHAFVNHETEFRNYNQLKPSSSNTVVDGQAAAARNGSGKRARRGGTGHRTKNQTSVVIDQPSSSGSNSKKNVVGVDEMMNHDYERMYEDEYDVANKAVRKSNPNLQLIDSINKELKRVATGYRPDASNA